jgi:hypothetical protein
MAEPAADEQAARRKALARIRQGADGREHSTRPLRAGIGADVRSRLTELISARVPPR